MKFRKKNRDFDSSEISEINEDLSKSPEDSVVSTDEVIMNTRGFSCTCNLTTKKHQTTMTDHYNDNSNVISLGEYNVTYNCMYNN